MGMNPFPADWELIGLFETEPLLADVGVPWSYNRLEFSTERRNGLLKCIIEPGYETLKLQWSNERAPYVDLDLHWVSGIEVKNDNGREWMVVTMRDQCLFPLEVQLKPGIAVFWGTTILPG